MRREHAGEPVEIEKRNAGAPGCVGKEKERKDDNERHESAGENSDRRAYETDGRSSNEMVNVNTVDDHKYCHYQEVEEKEYV